MEESASWGGVPDDEEKDEEQSQDDYFSGSDAIIVLIDCSKNMFNDKGEGTAFELSLKCARNLMNNKIISSNRDLVGIVFFGTEVSKNPSDFAHINIFQELSLPGAEKIKALDEILTGGASSFESTYGHNSNYSISDALWACSSMFSQAKNIAIKRILLFTNDDNPHRNDPQLCQQAKRRANDLEDTGIKLDLMHMKNSHGLFDVNTFYRELINLEDDEDLPDPSEKFDELLERVRTKQFQRRRLNIIKLTLAEGLEIGASIYTLVRPTSVPYAVRLSKDNNDILRSLRRTYISETGEILFPSDMRKFIEYADKRIKFDLEEIKEIKKICSPGLRVLGFKPISSLKLHHYMKPSNFLHPDEEIITGSAKLFSALLTKCLEREQMIICRSTPRANSSTQLVALIPQEEEIREKLQIMPPGFHILVLPYAEDIRKLTFDESQLEKADQKEIDIAKQIVKKLQFKYDPDAFENPVLQTHWKNIEAIALDLDIQEKVVDYTKPKDDIFEKRCGQLIKQFKEIVFPSGFGEDVGLGKKHKTAKDDDGVSQKRTKIDKDISDKEIEKLAKSGELNKLTVEVLKNFCVRNNIKPGRKKELLVNSITEHFENT